jgi:hypothetical protein
LGSARKDLEVRLIRYGRAQFEHDGKTEVWHIELLEPPDWWEASGAVPYPAIDLAKENSKQCSNARMRRCNIFLDAAR